DLQTQFVTRGGVVRAVDGVSWDVAEGETVALVGESGCGKSVSALSIMRLVAAPAGRVVGGRILFKGRDLLQLDEESMRRVRGSEIAMIFQEPMTSLNPVLTIGRQITEGLETHLGMAPTAARYADRVNVMYAGKIIERGTAREIYATPRHPYTLGLLRSVPRLDEPRRARLDPIEGQPPDLTRLPGGCAFAPRCAFRVERCVVETPPLRPIGAPGHVTACWEAERLTAVREPVGGRR